MSFNPFSILTSKIFGGLAALLLVGFVTQTIRIEGMFFIVGYKEQVQILRIDLTKARARTEAEIAKHVATKQAYREAQAEAERMEAERLVRVTQQQEEITNEIISDYQRRLAAARVRADRLRDKRRGGSAGSPDSQPVPGVPTATSGVDEAPGGDGLSVNTRLIATEQAIQLDGLITFVERQAHVDPNQ